MTDTFERSCAHWSADKLGGMEDFYVFADEDHVNLAAAHDWRLWLEAQQGRVGPRPLRLLDVACGVGKFPTALVRDADVGSAAIRPIDYALLDPSPFSITSAGEALKPPFVAGEAFPCKLQELDCPDGAFDIAWAVHALYAIPPEELDAALDRMLSAVNGVGVIAHASATSHYIRFDRLHRAAFGDDRVGFSSAEDILSGLERLGARHHSRGLSYEARAPERLTARVEGYLQRCVFDERFGLDEMRADPALGPYLAARLNDGVWRFPQRVELIFFET